MAKKPAKQIQPCDLCKTGDEHGEQSALICWVALDSTKAAHPDAIKIFAINNNAGQGEKKDAAGIKRGMRAKMAGVRPGVSDLFLPVARHGVHGLFIEMKVRKLRPKRKGSKGGLSDKQIEFGGQVQGDGYGFVTCYGWEHAAEVISAYLS